METFETENALHRNDNLVTCFDLDDGLQIDSNTKIEIQLIELVIWCLFIWMFSVDLARIRNGWPSIIFHYQPEIAERYYRSEQDLSILSIIDSPIMSITNELYLTRDPMPNALPFRYITLAVCML